jgi:signal transduction histidine kinase
MDAATAELLKASIHELKGPANRLRILAQLLARKSELRDEDARTLLGYVEDSASAVGSVADGFRNYIESCTRPLQRQPLDLNSSLASAITNLAGQLKQAGARVTHSPLPVIHADAFLFCWVFQELIANSLRAHSDGELLIHVCSGSDPSGREYISVSDNGPGIGSGMDEKIFRPFEKLAPGGGAGLGLTICRRIIERHGGRMWAEDRAEGAEFRFFVDNAM